MKLVHTCTMIDAYGYAILNLSGILALDFNCLLYSLTHFSVCLDSNMLQNLILVSGKPFVIVSCCCCCCYLSVCSSLMVSGLSWYDDYNN